MPLTPAQRAIFDLWYTARREYALDPASPETMRTLAEAAFERGVQLTEIERGISNGRLVTRYGKR